MRSFRLCHRFRVVRLQTVTPAARRTAQMQLTVADDGMRRIATLPAGSSPAKRVPRMFLLCESNTQRRRETDGVQGGMIMAGRAERGWR